MTTYACAHCTKTISGTGPFRHHLMQEHAIMVDNDQLDRETVR